MGEPAPLYPTYLKDKKYLQTQIHKYLITKKALESTNNRANNTILIIFTYYFTTYLAYYYIVPSIVPTSIILLLYCSKELKINPRIIH